MLASIGQKARSFSRWIGDQVVDNDFGSGDEKTRDYAVLGTAAGAVAGGAVGTVLGFRSQGDNQINEVWVDRDINHPQMNGYRHYTVPVYDTDCTTYSDGTEHCTTEIEGWWHHYSPNISNRKVGGYTEPTFQNSNFLEPLLGGVLGSVAGGALGLAAGIGVAALEKSMQDGKGKVSRPVELEPEVKAKISKKAGAAVLTGAAVGAGIGVFLGNQAGQAELASQQIHDRTWSIPVTQSETLGYVPSSHYEWNWSGFPLPLGGNRAATEPVVRQVPVYDRAGNPRITHTSETFTTNRYGPIFGGIAGGVVGAGVGLAAGVAFGVGDKLLTQNAMEKAQENGQK